MEMNGAFESGIQEWEVDVDDLLIFSQETIQYSYLCDSSLWLPNQKKS